MAKYAERTSVPVESSRGEIEKTLKRYGADAFMYGSDPDKAVIGFRMAGRMYRYTLPLPPLSDFAATPGGQERSLDAQEKVRDQVVRQRWRALALVIKAKLEAVESGIVTLEDEFLAHTMLPGGITVGEWARPDIEQAYISNKMPAQLLLGGPAQ